MNVGGGGGGGVSCRYRWGWEWGPCGEGSARVAPPHTHQGPGHGVGRSVQAGDVESGPPAAAPRLQGQRGWVGGGWAWGSGGACNGVEGGMRRGQEPVEGVVAGQQRRWPSARYWAAAAVGGWVRKPSAAHCPPPPRPSPGRGACMRVHPAPPPHPHPYPSHQAGACRWQGPSAAADGRRWTCHRLQPMDRRLCA